MDMKANCKGQALVEFVLILPIFIFLIFLSVDIGRIIYAKNRLETKLNEAVELLEEKKDYDEVIKLLNKNSSTKIKLDIKYKEDKYATVKIINEVDIFTPGLNLILSDPYEVFVTREVIYE